MSRLKRFGRGVFSSYALLGVNVLYTLISMPLALAYLSKPQFGLWALTLQVSTYLGMLDLGMGSSVSRILIDYKDQRSGGEYGSTVQSGFLVGIVQGTVALAAGLCVVWFLGDWLNIGETARTAAEKAELQHQFLWLMVGQVIITAATFATRMLNQILFAWQRMDISNYSGMIHLLAGLATLWLCFSLGFGVYSLLVGAAIGWISGVFSSFVMCRRLGLFPHSGEWGKPGKARFKELFMYGADLFLISLGAQLIMSSQVVLIARQFGEETVTLWSVMTKVFSLLSQAVWRLIGNAMPALAEMHVRKEHEVLWDRYRQLFITVSVLSAIAAVIFAMCNGPFVKVWMNGKFSWPLVNDVLLGIWLIVATQQCSHNSLIMCLREIRALKYMYLIEGLVFVAASVVALRYFGLTGMLVCSVIATILCTWIMGTWKTARLLHDFKPLVWTWQKPVVQTLGLIIPTAAALWFAGRSLPPPAQLALNAISLSVLGLVVALWTLPSETILKLSDKMPAALRRFLRVFSFSRTNRI